MKSTISLPLDDGFLRRECPNCHRPFKWHNGPTDARPDDFVDPKQYHCPYCGLQADVGSWFTQEQTGYISEIAGHEFSGMIEGELERAFKPLKNSDFISVSVDYKPEPKPRPLKEQADMTLVEPPCHPFEPLKVQEGWDLGLHCLVCGASFST